MDTLEVADHIDLMLIRHLQEDPRATYAEIARAARVSETTVRRRVDALINAHTITPAMLPDLYQLGFRTSAMIGLRVDLHRLHEIAETIRDYAEVTMVAITTGRFDILFFVAFPTLDELVQFLVDRIAPIEGVRETETMVTPRVLKVLGDWRVPLDQALSRYDRPAADGSGTADEQATPHGSFE